MNAKRSSTVVVLSFVLVEFAMAQHIDSVNQMKEVNIVRKQATHMEMKTQNVELISSADLQKDACCNLSESFMRTGAVDMQYSDGISGAKEIRMLGLAGNYLQSMYENMPGIRGINATFGMEYMPGPWLQSIQINKGTGSVVNGYEAITGQMNLELKKPQSAERFFANVYMNQDARTEVNLYGATKLGEKPWYVMGLVHGSVNWVKMDMNKDGFMDNPLHKRFTAMNRWFHLKKDGGMFMLVGDVNFEQRQTGQLAYDFRTDFTKQDAWGNQLNTNHVALFSKTSFNFSHESSLGIQWKYTFQDQHGFIADKLLRSREHFGYLNLIYQNEFTEGNTIKVGGSVLVNAVQESLATYSTKRTEIVPGIFSEVTFNPLKKLNIVGGLRVDHHNLFGTFLSPRLHLKWDALYALTIRASAGRGYRTPNLIADNYAYFFSHRTVQFGQLKPEIAWNYGVSLAYKFNLAFREGWIHVDFYRTDFERQLVVDLEQRDELNIYTANGKSYSNSLQAEVSYEVAEGFNAKLAYKWDNVKVNYKSGLAIQALKPQHKVLVVLDYNWDKPRLLFTANFVWYSKSRIPAVHADEHVHANYLYTLNMQITKKIKEQWQVYVGAENMLNQMQHNPILSAEQPFNKAFDATLIWGPIRGAMVYAGFRFVLK